MKEGAAIFSAKNRYVFIYMFMQLRRLIGHPAEPAWRFSQVFGWPGCSLKGLWAGRRESDDDDDGGRAGSSRTRSRVP